jgi:hypothetical protein
VITGFAEGVQVPPDAEDEDEEHAVAVTATTRARAGPNRLTNHRGI